MSFAFGFASDDISDEEPEDLHQPIASLSINDTTPTVPVKKWSLTQLLSTLPDQITYNTLHIPIALPSCSEQPTISIPRRSLFDIRTQLMAEANPEFNANDALLSGLDAGDLTTGEYEGGFKTWECAVDLAGFLAGIFDTEQIRQSVDDEKESGGRRKPGAGGKERWHIIELGAGSAIPSLVLLQKALRGAGKGEREMRFTLCDYNEDVLKLCTAPNVLLTALLQQSQHNKDSSTSENDSEGEELYLNIEAALPVGPASLENTLKESGITVDCISGPWSQAFLDLLLPSHTPPLSTVDAREPPTQMSVSLQENILILASETIYSPSTLPIFTSTVLSILRSTTSPNPANLTDSIDPTAKTSNQPKARALVAAKKIYFGVGGGTDEFGRCVRSMGGRVRRVSESADGVGRVIIEVTTGTGVGEGDG